jgi:hypothetical protein
MRRTTARPYRTRERSDQAIAWDQWPRGYGRRRFTYACALRSHRPEAISWRFPGKLLGVEPFAQSGGVRLFCKNPSSTGWDSSAFGLAYNITSVIHSQCELGIEPIFWPKLEGEERNLLPLVRPS